jgi:hypothetical protein
VDCGGSCTACPPARTSCSDRIQNGDERGVDCGGSCASCGSSPPPRTSCTDRIQNGDERGVDCGGSCSACPPLNNNTYNLNNNTDNLGNTTAVKGMCAGNTNPSEDITCPAGYAVKPSVQGAPSSAL